MIAQVTNWSVCYVLGAELQLVIWAHCFMQELDWNSLEWKLLPGRTERNEGTVVRNFEAGVHLIHASWEKDSRRYPPQQDTFRLFPHKS